jgi:hypothetical protein
VRACVHAEREGAGYQEIKAAAPFRRGGHAAVQTDGLLLQGGALVRREGRHDLLRQAEDPRAGQQLQPQGRHTQTGNTRHICPSLFFSFLVFGREFNGEECTMCCMAMQNRIHI